MDKWWKNAVGYQIFPKSFYDSNADGIGDIQGIISKLPYLKGLGIDFLWITPIYQSPGVDNGYDISDFKKIQEEFGTLEDLKELLEKAHTLGLKVLMDLVINHTSDQHPWFLEAKKSKSNPYRNYYHWQDMKKGQLPNNWQSFFGGSVWEIDEKTEQAYLHIFYKEQPDLNWKNEKMREEIYEMIRFWLEFGIDGFRLDAISHIQKEAWSFQIKENPWAAFMNVAGIETYMDDLRAIFKEYDCMTVGEASGVSSKKAREWTSDDGYINMIFELEHNCRKGKKGREKIDVRGFKKVLARWQKDLSQIGWNAPYVENHDNPRINSKLGNETPKSAKAIATMYLFLKGTSFIYQGQEIGMIDFPFTSVEQVEDISNKKQYQKWIEEGKEEQEALQLAVDWSRDNARTPMQWDSSFHAGFTSGQPKMPVHPDFQKVNVAEEEKDEHSVLNYYKKAIALRKQEETFLHGTFELLLSGEENTFIYLRKGRKKTMLILTNLTDKKVTVTLPKKVASREWKVLLSNEDSIQLTKNIQLSPYAAFVLESEEEDV